MIRFYLGEPQQLFLSEHAFGEVWPFDVITKGDSVPVRHGRKSAKATEIDDDDDDGDASDFGWRRRAGNGAGMDGAMRMPLADRVGWEGRPVVYSAEGSHALYGTSGYGLSSFRAFLERLFSSTPFLIEASSYPHIIRRQEYLLPFGLLHDITSPGPLWDPALNHRAFWLNTSTSTWWKQDLTFVPVTDPAGTNGSTTREAVGKGVLDYAGRWGDEFWSVGGGEREVQGQYCYCADLRLHELSGVEFLPTDAICHPSPQSVTVASSTGASARGLGPQNRQADGHPYSSRRRPMGPRYKYLDRRILDPVDCESSGRCQFAR